MRIEKRVEGAVGSAFTEVGRWLRGCQSGNPLIPQQDRRPDKLSVSGRQFGDN